MIGCGDWDGCACGHGQTQYASVDGGRLTRLWGFLASAAQRFAAGTLTTSEARKVEAQVEPLR